MREPDDRDVDIGLMRVNAIMGLFEDEHNPVDFLATIATVIQKWAIANKFDPCAMTDALHFATTKQMEHLKLKGKDALQTLLELIKDLPDE